jgi:predicted Rossmann fold flavoprotein
MPLRHPAAAGAHVLVLEKMTRPGEKLLITGKSRCNLTNDRDLSSFLAMYGPNGPFLHGAFHRFFRADLTALLARYGVETKTERGGRVFPASDRAADVVEALVRHMNDQGALLQTGQRVTGIRVVDGRVEGVDTESGPVPSAAVVLATGGASWPGTGSSGEVIAWPAPSIWT